MPGCVLDSIYRWGGDIKQFENISSYSDCLQKCTDVEDCSVWAYVTGTCWMKNQNTVTVNNPTAVAGTTDCKDEGKYAL